MACRAGEMIADGQISDVETAVNLMTEVALGVGLTHSEVRGTIRSGLGTSGVTP